MIPAKFISWALDKIPSLANWIGKEVRSNEVKNIDKAVDTSDDKYINNKLQQIKSKYEKDTRASS